MIKYTDKDINAAESYGAYHWSHPGQLRDQCKNDFLAGTSYGRAEERKELIEHIKFNENDANEAREMKRVQTQFLNDKIAQLTKERDEYAKLQHRMNVDMRGLLDENIILREAILIAADQLEGCAIAVNVHGNNINVDYFIEAYTEAANKARAAIAEGEKR